MNPTVHHLTRGNGGTSGTVYNTASISPTAGRPVIATFLGSSGTPGTVNTLTGAGLTWTKIFTKQAVSNGARWVSVFLGLGTPSSGALQATFNTNQGDAYWTVFEIGGNSEKSAGVIRQINSSNNTGSHTGLTVNLNAFEKALNLAVGVFFWGQGATITVGSGFTELNQGQNSIQILTEYKVNDNSVDASWSSANNWSMAVAMEVSIPLPKGGNPMFILGGRGLAIS